MSGTLGVGEARSTELQELAEHFDTTDAGELAWEDATDIVIARPELEQVSLRLPQDDLAELKRRARRAGVGYTTLIRMILRQHLQNPLAR
jgi:predicted DNA binding CopG/RHH family protein